MVVQWVARRQVSIQGNGIVRLLRNSATIPSDSATAGLRTRQQGCDAGLGALRCPPLCGCGPQEHAGSHRLVLWRDMERAEFKQPNWSAPSARNAGLDGAAWATAARSSLAQSDRSEHGSVNSDRGVLGVCVHGLHRFVRGLRGPLPRCWVNTEQGAGRLC
jgi:hypothetical protein